MSKRLVGYRRVPQNYVSLYNTVLIDGELCDSAGDPILRSSYVPVYEGDPGWEELEEEIEEAERQLGID